MTTDINYISAIPGLGKTQWAVAQLVKCIKRQTRHAIYVAPTVELLLEVESYLKKYLTAKEMKRVRVFHSKGGKVGTVVHSVKMNLVGGKDQFGRVFKDPEPGMVLLITHATFMNLQDIPGSEDMDLYFDEARKCVSQSSNIKLSSKRQKELVLKCLKLIRHKNTGYYKASSDISRSDYQKLMAQAVWETKQLRAVEALVRAARNKRLDTYISSVDGASLKIFEVTMPSKIFDGFRTVTLMSAFFEDSQMYHLLKQSKANLVDVSKTSIPNYAKRHSELISRYQQVSVIPLLKQDKAISKTDLNGFLISSLRPDLLEHLEALGFQSRGRLKVLKEYVLDSRSFKLSDSDQKALKLLDKNKKDFHFEPMKWLLSEARKAILRWVEAERVGGTFSPLLIVNKRYEKEAALLAPDYKIISTQVHGLNKYYQHDVVVFLAAINPTPDLCRFYRILLKEYDVEKDHVADVCIQCVCRCSVRDTKATKPTLVIVSDLRLMQHLSEKMFNRPTLAMNKSPKRAMISANLYEKASLKVRGVVEKKPRTAVVKDYLNKGVNRKIQSARNKVSRYKKLAGQGKEGAREKWLVAKKEFDRLVALRDKPIVNEQRKEAEHGDT